MTGEELEELGRRAVACKHWRWLRGMTALAYHRTPKTQSALVVTGVHGDGIVLDGYVEAASAYYPDLRDPATLGCLLHLVREAWECDNIASGENASFCTIVINGIDVFHRPTLAEALVAALEAAP